MENFALPLFWIIVAVIAAILEGCTFQLVSIWFTVGAVASAVVSAFNDNILLQLSVFVIVSIICVAATRPLANKLKNKNGGVATNCDRNIGKIAEVVTDINNVEASGQVKVDGAVWSAKSTIYVVIPAGTMVKVDKIEGVKLVVTPVVVNEFKGTNI